MYELKAKRSKHRKKTVSSRTTTFSHPQNTICLPLTPPARIPDSPVCSVMPVQRYYDLEFVYVELKKIEDKSKNAAAISALLDQLTQYGYFDQRSFQLRDVTDDTSKLWVIPVNDTAILSKKFTREGLCQKLSSTIADKSDSFASKNKQEFASMSSAINIGTEFTFQHTDTAFCFGSDELNLRRSCQSVKKADQSIAAWAEKISQLSTGYQRGVQVNSIVVSDGDKKWGDSVNYTAKKVTFNFYLKNEKITFNWILNIDLDPNCIETQTTPTTPAVYHAISEYIQYAVFKTAKDVHLKPDPDPNTGGGGHISIDTAGAFRENAVYLRNFLVLYANMAKKNIDVWVTKCTDKDNAPFLFELGPRVEESFKNVIDEFDHREAPTMEWLVGEIQTRVYGENLTATLTAMRVPPADAPHYQAVNLENLLATEGRGRIEMRRFNAQASIYELMEDIENLMTLLQKSRQTRKIPVDFTL